MSTGAASIKLSICMPTYNFGAFVGEALTSIVRQLVPGVEVVVFDGGSTDNTGQVVRQFVSSYPAISYVKQDFRGGIDRDMARTIELARGEYCWLFSSDDVMKQGALQVVLREIESGLDLYLCGLTLCDKRMAPFADHRISRASWGSIFDLRNAADRQRYFAAAETTTAFFSFMGSLFLRRSRWMEHVLDERYVGSCWAHVVRILRMIPAGLTVKYLGESLQLKRGDNDSFMDKGLIHRYAIAIDGFHRIAQDVFGDQSFEARHIRRVIVNEFPLRVMLFTKADCKKRGRLADIPELNRLANKAYSGNSARNVLYRAGYRLFPVRLFPVRLYEIARHIYRTVRRRFHHRETA